MGLENAEQALVYFVGQAVKNSSLVKVSILAFCDQAKVRNGHHFPYKQDRKADRIHAETSKLAGSLAGLPLYELQRFQDEHLLARR